MPIYEQPTKVLMNEFAKAELTPGQVFTKPLPVAWFSKHYPKIKSSTVQMHVEGMSVNSTLRQHHKSIYAGSGHDLFWKVGPGQFRLWNPKQDPKPVYGDEKPVSYAANQAVSDESDDDQVDAMELASSEFAAERDLRNYLEKNLGALEPGLRLYEEEGLTGIEFPAGGRRIDILANGGDGAFVVIELKVSRGYDRVMGQIMRYMAWVKENLADGKPVRGIIVASEITNDLKLAASMVVGVKLVEYELSFKLKSIA
jgi:hypothetical protein